MVITDAQTGCPTDADHLSRYLLESIRGSSHKFGIFHFTDGMAMTWFEFARNIEKSIGPDTGGNLISKGDSKTGVAKRPKSSILLNGPAKDVEH